MTVYVYFILFSCPQIHQLEKRILFLDIESDLKANDQVNCIGFEGWGNIAYNIFAEQIFSLPG